MRFLENDGDNIEVFENILNELSHLGTNEVIPDLCTIFEDDIAEPSAVKCYLMQSSGWKEYIGHF